MRNYTTAVIEEGDLAELMQPSEVYCTISTASSTGQMCVIGVGRGLSIHISPSDAIRLGNWISEIGKTHASKETVNER